MCDGVDCNHLAQDTIMKFGVFYKAPGTGLGSYPLAQCY